MGRGLSGQTGRVPWHGLGIQRDRISHHSGAALGDRHHERRELSEKSEYA